MAVYRGVSRCVREQLLSRGRRAGSGILHILCVKRSASAQRLQLAPPNPAASRRSSTATLLYLDYEILKVRGAHARRSGSLR